MNLLELLVRKETGPSAALHHHETEFKTVVRRIQSETRFPILSLITGKQENLLPAVEHAASVLDQFASTITSLADEQRTVRDSLLEYCGVTAEELTTLVQETHPDAPPGIPPLHESQLSDTTYLTGLPAAMQDAMQKNDERMRKLILQQRASRKRSYLTDAHALLRVYAATTGVLESIADIVTDDAQHYGVVMPAQVKIIEHTRNIQAIARTTHLVRATTTTIYGRAREGLYLAKNAYQSMQLPAVVQGRTAVQPLRITDKQRNYSKT